jgi:tRNA(Ile)-lysidine synthase
MSLAARVLDTIRRHALMRRGDRVLVALSGGSDSVALLRVLRELEAAGELAVAGVAHLNHGIRDAAQDDEQFCRGLAASMSLPFRSDRVDVPALAARLELSVESAGRRARYELFERVAAELAADVVATGHTRDDQAETFLLRLLRGAGSRGLAGIRPRAGRVVRPLLDVRRGELRAYLAELGQPFREDETNSDRAIVRNRVRAELLPLLARDYSPGIADVLAREAEVARLDEDRLHEEAIDLLDSIVLRSEAGNSNAEDAVELDADGLRALHPALGTRVVRLALERVAPGQFVGFDHVERVLELARDASHGSKKRARALPGLQAERQGDRVVLSRPPAEAEPFANSFRVSLSIPGEVLLIPQGWAVSATWCTEVDRSGQGGWHLGCNDTSHLTQPVAADGVTLPLVVRSRQPGDRLRPLGMGGREKKLQDVLVDRKVARGERDSLPLVVDSADNIVWIVGVSVAEDFRVTEASQAVIFLKARRLGGQG